MTAEATLAAIAALHEPFAIYDECDHKHQSADEPGVVDLEDIGLTCAKMYDICKACCTNRWGEQNEECTGHEHGPDKPICATRAIIDAREPEANA